MIYAEDVLKDGCYPAIESTNKVLGDRGVMQNVPTTGMSETWSWERQDGRSLSQRRDWSSALRRQIKMGNESQWSTSTVWFFAGNVAA